jgi:Amt family ammonium transporter
MWNGVSTPVTGLFYGGGAGQLLAQLAEGLALPVTAFASSYAFFLILMRLRLLRVSREVELAGLDLPEMGTEGYPKDWEPTPEALGLRRPRTAPAGLAAAAGD